MDAPSNGGTTIDKDTIGINSREAQDSLRWVKHKYNSITTLSQNVSFVNIATHSIAIANAPLSLESREL